MISVTVNDKNKFEIDNRGETYTVNGVSHSVAIHTLPNGMMQVQLDGKSYTVFAENTDRKSKEITLRVGGGYHKAQLKEEIDIILANMGIDLKATGKAEAIKAPMPGLVLKILVTEGQSIKKGDGLLILEAMKMENILKATADAQVKTIKAVERTAVEKGTVLIELE
jgi:biotin carboxyl carrier protein